MRFFLQHTSLFFKVILVTSLILIFAIFFNVWWNTSLHEASIQKLTHEKTKIISEFIDENVIRAMVKGRHFDMHRILKSFFTYKDIQKINIFNMDGVIKSSTKYDEINKKVDHFQTYLNNRHCIRDEIIQLQGGKKERVRVCYFSTPILNRPECYQCHGKKEPIIGILTIVTSLRDMDNNISKIRFHSIIFAILTIVFLSFALGFLFFTFIRIPIKKLTKTMRKVEEGDFSARADIKSKDEMGHLGESLNLMIERLRLAQQESEQYHQELMQRADRMISIGELASGLAHEIRNPLAGIQGAIQILSEGFPKGDPRRQVSEEIQKQIYKVEHLVKGLLNYAKPSPANFLPTDINGLIDKVLSFFIHQQGLSEHLRVEKKFSFPLPPIMIDPGSMEQVFLNILLNAQKAMPKGGNLTISTLVIPKKRRDHGEEIQEVQIIFEDTGTGIPEESLHQIFNPFFSTRPDGTGLGLSITKNIVEQHGGRIEVESQMNVGTKFIITLPVVK